jgi:hypothetical protein
MDHVHHTPRPTPDRERLAWVQEQIEALFAEAAGEPLNVEQAKRYNVLLRADYVARQGGARGREGEDEEERVLTAGRA